MVDHTYRFPSMTNHTFMADRLLYDTLSPNLFNARPNTEGAPPLHLSMRSDTKISDVN